MRDERIDARLAEAIPTSAKGRQILKIMTTFEPPGVLKPLTLATKKAGVNLLLSWLGMRDSNPRSRDQNPVPYHLANPQYFISER